MCKTEPAAKFGMRKTDEINERQYSLSPTLKRQLRFFCFTWRKTRKQAIRSINGTRRVNWCRDKLHRTINNNRKKVILALKLKAVIDQNKRVYIWRRPDEILQPECLGVRGNGKYSVMFWGCVTHEEVGTFTAIDANINSQKEINILETKRQDHERRNWPVAHQHFEKWNSPFSAIWIFRGKCKLWIYTKY